MKGLDQLDRVTSWDFIQFAEEVCAREALTLTVLSRDMLEWRPVDQSLFQEHIALSKVRKIKDSTEDEVRIFSATFEIGGDDGEAMTVLRAPDLTLESDRHYAPYFFQRFSGIYLSHIHSFCVGAVRKNLQAELHKQRLLHGQARQSFTPNDRRGAR